MKYMFQKIHILTLVMIGEGRNELNILQGDPSDWSIDCQDDIDCPEDWFCASNFCLLPLGFSGISDEFYAPSVDDIDNKLSSREQTCSKYRSCPDKSHCDEDNNVCLPEVTFVSGGYNTATSKVSPLGTYTIKASKLRSPCLCNRRIYSDSNRCVKLTCNRRGRCWCKRRKGRRGG